MKALCEIRLKTRSTTSSTTTVTKYLEYTKVSFLQNLIWSLARKLNHDIVWKSVTNTCRQRVGG